MVRMPFSVSWQGALRIDAEGLYEIEARGSGPYSVRLDGAVLFEVASVVPENPAMEPMEMTDGSILGRVTAVLRKL